jgi:hypothetical protein
MTLKKRYRRSGKPARPAMLLTLEPLSPANGFEAARAGTARCNRKTAGREQLPR